MPRVKFADERPRNFRIWIKGYIMEGCGMEAAAKRMGCSRTTAYDRMKHPGNLTLEELHGLRMATGVPLDALMEQIRVFL